MNIYIKLSDFNQAELLAMLPPAHQIAIEIKNERHHAETKAFRLSHEQISKDVKIYLDSGKTITLLPPDPKPGSLRKRTIRKVRVQTPIADRAIFKNIDKNTLMALLKEQLNAILPGAK